MTWWEDIWEVCLDTTVTFCVARSAGWLAALYRTWLSACPIRCGFISSLMKVWAQLALRSTTKVHRLISSPTNCIYVGLCLIQESNDSIFLSFPLPLWPLFFISSLKNNLNQALRHLTWTFIDNAKEEKNSSKYFAWLNTLLLLLSLYFPPILLLSLAHRNCQRELWWPWYTTVWLPRG